MLAPAVLNGLHTMAMDIELGQVADENNQNTLLDLINNRPNLARWMQWSGCIWNSGHDKITLLSQCYYIFVRICLLYSVGVFVFTAIDQDLPTPVRLQFVLGLFMILSAIPGHYYNQNRLHASIGKLDGIVLDRCVVIITYYATVSCCSVCYMIACDLLAVVSQQHPNSTWPLTTVWIALQFYSVAYLSFNLLILLIDAHVTVAAIEQLAVKVDEHTIDMISLAAVRYDVHKRSDDSKWVTCIVIVPCVAAIICIIISVFILETEGSTFPTFEIVFITSAIFSFTRDVLFVGIAFWYVAKANGRADELTVQLSRTIWCPSGEQWVPDMSRLSVYASSLSEPITYKLLLRRISWADVTVNLISVSLTLLVGLVKYFAGV